MTNKAERRVKRSLLQRQLSVKDEKLYVEQRRRADERQRLLDLAALRILCERYGDNEWDDATNLIEIVQFHLVEPLARQLAEAEAQFSADLKRLDAAYRRELRRLAPVRTTMSPPATPAPQPSPPQPLRPTPVPVQQHRCLVVRAESRHGETGHRATCLCGWTSRVVTAETDAIRVGDEHCSGRVIHYQDAR